jgi:hypothetical protein
MVENGGSPTLAPWRTGAETVPLAKPRQRRPFPGVQGDDVAFGPLLRRELAPLGLHEPGFLAFHGDLTNQS